MVPIIRRIANVTMGAVLAVNADAAMPVPPANSGRPRICRLPAVAPPPAAAPLRRLPPLDKVRGTLPDISREPSTARLPAVAERELAPSFRRLPPVESSPIESLPTPAVDRQFRRLPDLDDEHEDDEREQAAVPLAPNYAERWQSTGGVLVSVAEQSRVAIENGFRLAEKGALFSARAEFVEALRGVSLGLDAHFSDSIHTDCLLAGVRALREADDFVATGHRLESPLNVAATAAAHKTQTDVSGLKSAVLAMQAYYAFTQDRLAVAAGGCPAAADALYGLGKIYMALAQQSSAAESMPGPKSMVYLGAALQVDPSHAMAANELGVLYARLGKLHEARDVFQQSVRSQPLAESWQNLAVVHQRLGETTLAAQAAEQAQLLSSLGGAPDAGMPAMVRWVDPEAFSGAQQPTPASRSAPLPPPRSSETATRRSWFW